MGFHEDDIYDKMPKEYKQFFEPEYTMNGKRSGHEYATCRQRTRDSNGGFGFGYHNEIENGKLLFVERWIPSNPPTIDGWDKLKQLAEKKNWPIIVSDREGATSVLIRLDDGKIEQVIDTIISFLDTVSMKEVNLSFLEASHNGLY